MQILTNKLLQSQNLAAHTSADNDITHFPYNRIHIDKWGYIANFYLHKKYNYPLENSYGTRMIISK